MSGKRSISITRERWRSTDFAIAPFASAQEGPNPVVIPDLNPEILEVFAHRQLNLFLLNEQDCTIKPNVQVRKKYGAVWDIITAKIENICNGTKVGHQGAHVLLRRRRRLVLGWR